MESLSVDIPFDGLGLIGLPAADAISPVYTVWITLVLMYLGGCTVRTLKYCQALDGLCIQASAHSAMHGLQHLVWCQAAATISHW